MSNSSLTAAKYSMVKNPFSAINVVDYHFTFVGESRPCIFTSFVNGKWNGVFSVDGQYRTNGVSWNDRKMILNRISDDIDILTAMIKSI